MHRNRHPADYWERQLPVLNRHLVVRSFFGKAAGHEPGPKCEERWSVDIPSGSRHDALMKRLFQQLR